MLVLSRRPGEQIMIGGDIVVTVTKISGDRVKIGIEAPGDVRVLRGELYDAAFHASPARLVEPDCVASRC